MAAYLPNAFSTTMANKNIPKATPMITGMKNNTFLTKSFFKSARNFRSGSYKPKITASTPPDNPGRIAPIPTRVPFSRRMIQSVTGFILL